MSPTATNGKICYVEIPTGDVEASAAFYREVFGWSIRTRGDGATAFDDTTAQVSGAFVTGRPAMAQPGPLVYVMVDDAEAACRAVAAAGGEIVQAVARMRVGGGAASFIAAVADQENWRVARVSHAIRISQPPIPTPEPCLNTSLSRSPA
jgi:predicted enzyme related to lactoylglutathione lyase